MKLTASIASLTPFSASLSSVMSRSGLLAIGKSSFGLVQLRGRSLVPKPPAKIKAFNVFFVLRIGI